MLSRPIQSFLKRLNGPRGRQRSVRRTGRRHGRQSNVSGRLGNWGSAAETLEDRLLLSAAPPTITAPASQSVAENVTTSFGNGGVSFGDSFAAAEGYGISDSVSISVGHGSLVLGVLPGPISGITIVSGSPNSPSVTIAGTVAALDSALNSLAYAPNSGFTGSDSLQISVTDPADNLTATAAVPITVVPILINAPQSWGAILDQGSIPGPLSIVDGIASSASDSVTLSVTEGTLDLFPANGLTVTSGSNNSSSVTVNGTLPSLNQALEELDYKPNDGYLGSDTLQISVADANDNASAMVAIPITVSVSPPYVEIMTEGTFGAREDSPGTLIFQPFRIFDEDFVDNSDFLTISVTDGTIPAPGWSDNCIVTAGAYGSSSVTLNGPFTALRDVAESGLIYAPNPGYSGPDTVQVSLYDSVDGLSASNSVPIVVYPAPILRGPNSVTAPTNSPYTFPANSFSLIDAAATGTSDSLSLSVSDGSLSLGSTTGLTFTAGSNGSSSMTMSGTLANLNAALDGLVYSPTSNPDFSDTLFVSLNDSGNNASEAVRTYFEFDGGPNISISLENISLNENSSFAFSNGSFSVFDSNSSTASLSLSVGDGTLALPSTAGLTFNSGANNSSSMTVTGSLQNINAAFNGLVYTPNALYSGSDTLKCTISDPVDTSSQTDYVSLTINGLPSLSAPSTARVDENGVLPFPNASITSSDAAALALDSSDMLTLSVGHGNLTVLPIPGVTILAGANNSSSMTVIGTVADLNAAVAGVVYTPDSGFNGWDTLALSAYDQLDGLTGTTNVAIAVDAPPSIQVPGPTAVTENVPYTFSGSISVLDATSLGTSDSLTLAVSDGTLTLGSTTGVSFVSGSNGASSMTITGTLTNLNAALSGLVYAPGSGYTGADSLQISAIDSGDNFTASAAVVITVLAPPAISAPATANLNENTSYTFTGSSITLADASAGGTSDSLSLSVVDGKLTLGSTTGLTFSSGSNGSTSMTVTGTLANLNVALNGLVYAPNAGYSGADSLSMSLKDSGDNLTGAAAVAITVHAPPAISAPATASLNENASYTFAGSSIALTDSSASGTSDSLSISVLDGKLTLGSTTGLTFSTGANGSASMTVTGTLANLNAAIAGLVYAPNSSYSGTDSLSLSLKDSGDNLAGSAAVAITVHAPPAISAPPNASMNEYGSYTFTGNAISVTDSSASGTSDSLRLSVADGTLTLATATGLTFTAGANGTASFTVTGTLANLNAALNGLTYQPTYGYAGSDSLAVSVTDSGDSLSASKSVALTITAVAPPSIAAPTTVSIGTNGTLVFSTANGDSISITDAAAGSSSDSLSLSVSHGTLTLSTTAGLTFTAGSNGSASFTATGSVANLNAALNGLTYKPTTGYTGTDTLAATIKDSVDNFSGLASVSITPSTSPPAITAPATAALLITSTLTFSAANKNAISIADVNAGSTVEPLSLTATDGTLRLGTTTGITMTSGSNGSASMTINGTLANLNAALIGLTFTPANVGAATVVLAYTDVGNGLMGTATINITVSKAPTKLALGSPVSPPPTPAASPGAAPDSLSGSATGAITTGSALAVGSPVLNPAASNSAVSNSAASNSPAATKSTNTITASPPDEEANQWAGVTPAVEVLIG